MKTSDPIDTKLRDALLTGARREGDYLVLADPVLRAALDGSRRLTGAEAAALQASPLTLRRLRQLSAERRRAQAGNDDGWSGSVGLLRAAAGSAPLTQLVTDDGWWRLHFLDQDGVWRVILGLDAGAPFAARMLREQPMLRVLDGGGAIVLQGRLDADGEVETRWPFELPPAPHFQLFGARFTVEPAA
jgi:hypothetical protein